MATRAPSTRATTRARAPSVTSGPAEATARATRSRTAAATTKSTTSTQTTTKKLAPRKPLANRANENDAENASKTHTKSASQKAAKPIDLSAITDREPIMAYLRIRPRFTEDDSMALPYLTPLSDTTVRMSDPQESQNNSSRYRVSTVSPSSVYTFSHVFPSNSTQSEFFTKTTLPLVRDVLMGQSGLLFTYGVTNSGKTYTIQGGTIPGSAGILPRTLDVLFNSIRGLHGEGRYRPVRLYGIEAANFSDSSLFEIKPAPAIAEVFGQDMDTAMLDLDIDTTVIPVDRNYEYTIWLSYAEVYNEKIYDLLESVKEDSTNVIKDNVSIAGRKSLILTRKALALKPSPASDAADTGATGKYISGLKQFRVQSATQAKALVKLGQLHRRVFGTLANRESSRSHGMVMIKVMRGHKGDRDDPSSLQTARLTLVDLAGSERTKHTQTTGDRLKEAGNINKSLMVLGQCMEVMRNNQRKLAASLSQAIRMDTREVKKGLAVVPFRHSKLTEALMDFFTGDGRTVMIVNVNPFDTGYDENSHVMRFAALTREVYISPAPAPVQRMPAFPTLNPTKTQGSKAKEPSFIPLKVVNQSSHRRKVTISIGSPDKGRKLTEAIVEVLEEDEPNDDDGEDDEPINPLVDALFDEVEVLRARLCEAEMRCAIIEAEVREEVMWEMEERMQNMEAIHSKRLMNELEQHELKTDAKIDMLHQSGLFGSPIKQTTVLSNVTEEDQDEEDVERSLILTEQADPDDDDLLSLSERSPSPLAGKNKGIGMSIRLVEPSSSADASNHNTPESNDSVTDDEGLEEKNDDDEWVPSPKQITSKNGGRHPSDTSKNSRKSKSSGKGVEVHALKLEEDMKDLTLQDNVGADDSVIIVPAKNRSKKKPKVEDNDDVDEDSDEIRPAGLKKKKR
ncbi:hypothetical protein AX15_001831 [Amanita polypyramis BW_CC]|nr:hypothetical protein AX15_001831 [Amanita polypyramis BW_CC]